LSGVSPCAGTAPLLARCGIRADEFTDGRRVRTLTLLDLFTRECLDIAVGRGLTSHDVVATLQRLRFDRGLPRRIYCDNGSEFVSAATDLWACTNGVIVDFSRRGKPPTMRPSSRLLPLL
jgi:putative transposase